MSVNLCQDKTKMKHILIPTDFSKNSRNAIDYALEYFAEIPVNFYLLHASLLDTLVKKDRQKLYIDNNATLEVARETSVLLDEEVQFCRQHSKNPNHSFIPIEENHNLVEAIRKQVREKEIDFILMGTRGGGKSKLGSAELGSNAFDVITKVKCPVFAIPENAKFTGIKNVALITDYNCLYRNKVISALSDTVDLHRSPLRVLHVKSLNSGLTMAQTDNKGFLHYFFKDRKHSFHFVENKDLEIGTQNFVKTWDISLVSVVAKNLNFIQRLLFHPKIKNINHKIDVPFLVLHE